MYKMHHAAAVHMYVGKFTGLFSSVSNSYHVVSFVTCSLDLNTQNKLKASKHKTRPCFEPHLLAIMNTHLRTTFIYFLYGCQSRRYTTLDAIHGYIGSVIFFLSFSSDSLIWTTDFDDERWLNWRNWLLRIRQNSHICLTKALTSFSVRRIAITHICIFIV
jgi:hypothetical protein